LSQGDFCVQEIAEIVGVERLSNISQQLRTLRLAGIVESRRNRTNVIYNLADEQVRRMIDYLRKEFLGAPNGATLEERSDIKTISGEIGI